LHISEQVLSAPVSIATAALGLSGFGIALRQVQKELGEKTTVLMGMLAAFVFAAQLVNFPIFVAPASGHLIGAVLAAVLLGPWAAAVVMGVVLAVQCLVFGDGAITALGANFLNLGLIAPICGWLIYDPIRRTVGGRSGVLIGAMIAAWFSVPLAAISFSIELAASGRFSDFPRVLSWMTLIHAAIGLGEAIVTGLVVRFVLLVRPDMIFEPGSETTYGSGAVRAGLGVLVVALAIAAFLSPFASSLDDGYEFVGKRIGFTQEQIEPTIHAPIAGYQVPGLAHAGIATAVAGVIGTLIVFASAWIMARVFVPRGSLAPQTIPPAESYAAGS
jgi:cobalt/nickel transport system permease protein